MKYEDCYELGYITKTKGLDGEVILFLDVDYPEDYEEMESVFVEQSKKLVPYFFDYIDIKGKKVIAHFEDIDDIEQAKTLVGCKLFMPLDSLPDLEEGQFYYHQIIGFTVVDQEKGALGKVAKIYDHTNQDLISMEYQGKEVLIPIVDEIVIKAHLEAEQIEVNLPEGLLDLYLEE